MRKCEILLLYGKKRKFCTIQNMKNIIIKHGNGCGNGWKRIASKLISRDFNEIEDAWISEKITLLRGYYGTEKRKEKASKASGVGTSDVYVSSWRFINNLDFLYDNLIPRKSYLHIDLETEEA